MLGKFQWPTGRAGYVIPKKGCKTLMKLKDRVRVLGDRGTGLREGASTRKGLYAWNEWMTLNKRRESGSPSVGWERNGLKLKHVAGRIRTRTRGRTKTRAKRGGRNEGRVY